MKPFVTGTEILACYEGSDHCPVIMEMEMPEKVPQEKCEALETVHRAGAGSRS
jgi:hypothetical protein